MNKQKMLVLQGIPCSGKTTWARDFLEDKTDWVRISRDDLRTMRGGYWIESQEKLITAWETQMIQFLLREGYNALIDATNLNPKAIEKWRQMANDHGVEIEFKYFPVTLEEALKRDRERVNPVGDKIVKRFYYKYIDDGRDERLRLYNGQDTNLPKAVICDIDGTLALRNGRGPFDFDKIGGDAVNDPVLNILQKYEPTHRIIILSGRNLGTKEDFYKYYDITSEWLFNKNVPYTKLLMRHYNDYRKDSEVKKELFEKYIKDEFYVELVLDDRDQVINMWRLELGLPCFQVWYGNF